LLEEQLSDGREWLFDTDVPSLIDISAHATFGWLSVFRLLRDIFDPKTVPRTVEVLPVALSLLFMILTGVEVDHPYEGVS
jgi:hypothetical protein